jgi:uncharacterized membrane protein YfcA
MMPCTDALSTAGCCGERELAGRASSATVAVTNIVCVSVRYVCVLAVCVCVVGCPVGFVSIAIVASNSFLKAAGAIVVLCVRLFVLERRRVSIGTTVKNDRTQSSNDVHASTKE